MTLNSSVRRRGGYVFGPFTLAADGSLLLREGAAVSLPPKVLQTLLVLVERAGEVVTKAELMEAVWPASIVEETGLSRNVSLLRQALDCLGESCIVTIARIGYRFVAPVHYCPMAPRTRSSSQSNFSQVARRPPAPVVREEGRLFVGRHRELETLAASLTDTANGRGRLLAVAGEPGIGKSTLVEHFLHEAGLGCHVGRGRCSERLSGAEPHLPVLEVLEELAADPDAANLLNRMAPTWEQALGPFRTPAAADASGSTDPASSGERLFREISHFFEQLSRRVPVVVVIEDVHWSDAATVDLLAHMASRLSRMRVLFLLTYRPHELLRLQHAFKRLRLELLASGLLEEVVLSPLEARHVQEYVAGTMANIEGGSRIAAVVHERSEGHPLFMVELVKYVQERGVTDASLEEIARSLPRTLAVMVDRALDALGPDARSLLSMAAVQGHEFDSATLAEVSRLEPVAVEDLLRACEQVHGLASSERETTLPDGRRSVRYRFAHALYQEALYRGLTSTRRMEWAVQIGMSLLRSHERSPDIIAGRAAVLLETGDEFWPASEQYLIASTNAARRFAFREAGELASRGLECLRRAPTTDPQSHRRREAELTLARYVALASLGGYGNVDLEAVVERLDALSIADREGPASGTALTTAWGVRMARGECAEAKDIAARLAHLAATSGDDVLAMNARMRLQIACHHLGEFGVAQEHADWIASAAPRIAAADRFMTMFDPVVASLAESSRNSWILGYFGRATSEAVLAVETATTLGHADSVAFAWLFQAWLHGHKGDWPSCLQATTAGVRVAQENGLAQTLAWNQCVRGWAQAHLGNVDDGIAHLAAGIQQSRRIMGFVAMPQFSAMMAEALLLRGEPSAAATWLGEARDFMDSHRDLYFAAEVYRLSAACLSAQGQHDAALEYLHRSLTVARTQGARTFELRAAMTLTAQRPSEGKRMLKATLTQFPEPCAWPDLIQAAGICGWRLPDDVRATAD